MLKHFIYLLTLVTVASEAAQQYCDQEDRARAIQPMGQAGERAALYGSDFHYAVQRSTLRHHVLIASCGYAMQHLAGLLYEAETSYKNSSEECLQLARCNILDVFLKKAQFSVGTLEKDGQSEGVNILSTSLRRAATGFEFALNQAFTVLQSDSCALAELEFAKSALGAAAARYDRAEDLKFVGYVGKDRAVKTASMHLENSLNQMLLSVHLCRDVEVRAFVRLEPSEVVLTAHNLLSQEGVTANQIHEFRLNTVARMTDELRYSLHNAQSGMFSASV